MHFNDLPAPVQAVLVDANTRSLTRAFPDEHTHDELAKWRLCAMGYMKDDLPGMLLDVMAICWQQGRDATPGTACPYVPR